MYTICILRVIDHKRLDSYAGRHNKFCVHDICASIYYLTRRSVQELHLHMRHICIYMYIMYLVSCWYICVWTFLTSLEKLFPLSIMPVLDIESSNLTKGLKRKMITINSNFVECRFSFRRDWSFGTGIHLPHPDPRSYPSWRPIFRFLQQRCMCVPMYYITGLCCIQLHQIGWLLLLCPYWWKGRLEWPSCHWRWCWRLGAMENEICLKWLYCFQQAGDYFRTELHSYQ